MSKKAWDIREIYWERDLAGQSLTHLFRAIYEAEKLTLCDAAAWWWWVDPQSRDFMVWKLLKDGDHDKLDEHFFSMALSVVRDFDIFSSSKVIIAF